MFDWFRRPKPEQRSVDGSSSYTMLAMIARAEAITDAGADLSGVVAGCASLWANGLAMAETDSELLTPEVLACMGRQLATEGNSVWYAVSAGVLTPEQAWMLAWQTQIAPEQPWTRRESDALTLFQWHLTLPENLPLAQ